MRDDRRASGLLPGTVKGVRRSERPTRPHCLFIGVKDDPFPEGHRAVNDVVESQACLFAARNRLQPADREDAMQEAYLAALQAMPKFDPNRGELEPFLRRCVEFRLRPWNHKRKMIRTCYKLRHQRQPRQVEMDLNEIPAAESTEREPLSELRRLIRLLPRLQLADRVLLVHLLAGETHAVIAGLLRVSRQRVGQMQSGLVERLRRLLSA